jgi:DNA-binding LytR/AlgR family response regulator
MDQKTREEPSSANKERKTDFRENYLVIRADHKYYKIHYEDLVCVEGQKTYITLHSENKDKITALVSLKELEEKLPPGEFIRIHKSYIVSIRKMDAPEGNQLEVHGIKLPVGKNYRQEIARVFGLQE